MRPELILGALTEREDTADQTEQIAVFRFLCLCGCRSSGRKQSPAKLGKGKLKGRSFGFAGFADPEFCGISCGRPPPGDDAVIVRRPAGRWPQVSTDRSADHLLGRCPAGR